MQFPPIPIQFEDQEYVISFEIRGSQPQGTGRTAYILYLALNELLTALAAPDRDQVEHETLPHGPWVVAESEKMHFC